MKILINDKLEAFNISKNKLSKMLGVSYPTILDLCNGTASSIRFEVLEQLCSIFHCTPNDILVPENDMSVPDNDTFTFDIVFTEKDNPCDKPTSTSSSQTENADFSESIERYKEYLKSLKDKKFNYQIRKDSHGNAFAFPYIILDSFDEIDPNKKDEDNNKDDTE